MDNPLQHINNDNMFKIDISKFYPSITRDKVYKFFIEKMDMSPDVAEIITNFATIDLDLKNQNTKNMKDVNKFIQDKKIRYRNHLATGTPFGSLLAYLVNWQMYKELQEYANKNNLNMSAYVDDIAFSTNTKISGVMRKSILNIIKKHHYNSNIKKCRYYGKNTPKRLTGGIITTSKQIDAQNKLINQANNVSKKIKLERNLSEEEIKHTYGLLSSIEMSERKMPNLKRQLKVLRNKNLKSQDLNKNNSKI